ncbi:DUF2855 family protein [Alteromonas sp. CYL-A6]|uniref:DUF2855 family protein n=1 Tax=Alteromonas nitratireducens TaxID=3390813 RepID=UPI0034A9FB8C
MTTHTITRMLVPRNALHAPQFETSEFDDAMLSDGDVLLRVDRFGLSANNITYAVMGNVMGYWGFFTAPDSYGIIPVWGFADVVASRHPDIPAGERVYGYLPFASHLVIRPDNITPYSFSDSHPERKGIHPVYDQYTRCAADPAYQSANEALHMNFRPLFMTSFVLDEAVAEAHAGDTIVITSASSKTALGCAFLLHHHRRKRNATYRIVALTSASNRDFVTSTGYYDDIISYDELATLPVNNPIAVLDFAANGDVLTQLHALAGSQFSTLWVIGATDWDAPRRHNIEGVDTQLFFAPEHVARLQKQWGNKDFMLRYSEAWKAFQPDLQQQFTLHNITGQTAMQRCYLDLLNGQAEPSELNDLRWG